MIADTIDPLEPEEKWWGTQFHFGSGATRWELSEGEITAGRSEKLLGETKPN